MIKKRLIPLLGPAILILGIPIALLIFTLTPSSQTADIFWYLKMVLAFIIVPALGGTLVAWKWGLWGILAAPLFVFSEYYLSRIQEWIYTMQNPSSSPSSNTFVGEAMIYLFILGCVGTVAAALAVLITTIVRWAFNRFAGKPSRQAAA